MVGELHAAADERAVFTPSRAASEDGRATIERAQRVAAASGGMRRLAVASGGTSSLVRSSSLRGNTVATEHECVASVYSQVVLPQPRRNHGARG